MNKVFLKGNIANDINVRYTKNGKSIVNFVLAVDRKKSETSCTDFIQCVAWEALGEEMARHLQKGSKVFVEGRIQIHKTEKDATTLFQTEVVADSVDFLR